MDNLSCVYCQLFPSCSIIYDNCNHKSCSSCILSIIFHGYLDTFQNQESINLTCEICKNGSITLSISQIITMLEKENGSSAKFNQYCTTHSIPTSVFCEECDKFICEICKKEHQNSNLNHKNNTNYASTYKNDNFSFRSVSTETDSKMKLPFKYQTFSQYKEHLDKSFASFEKKYEETNKNLISYIDKMIFELNQYKETLINAKINRLNREKEIMNLFKLFYQKYYSDIYQAFTLKEFKTLENICSSINRQFSSIEVYYANPIIEDLESLHEQITGYLAGMKELKFKYLFPTISHSYKNTKILIGHSDTINCAILLKEGDIASGGRDSVIRIWQKSKDYESRYTLEGHTGYISNLLLLNNNHLLSGSSDKTLKIWDPYNNFVNTHTLTEHTSWVSASLQLPNGTLITSSFDNTIIVRKNNSYKPKNILKEHTFGIFALVGLPDSCFASGGGDKCIKIWNKDFSVDKNLKGHNSAICCLALLKGENLIASGSNDKTIKIWNYSEGECVYTIKAHNDEITSLAVFKDGRLVSCGADNLIKIWDDENNFNNTHILKGHSSVVNALVILENNNILSASADKNMVIWTEQKNFSFSG